MKRLIYQLNKIKRYDLSLAIKAALSGDKQFTNYVHWGDTGYVIFVGKSDNKTAKNNIAMILAKYKNSYTVIVLKNKNNLTFKDLKDYFMSYNSADIKWAVLELIGKNKDDIKYEKHGLDIRKFIDYAINKESYWDTHTLSLLDENLMKFINTNEESDDKYDAKVKIGNFIVIFSSDDGPKLKKRVESFIKKTSDYISKAGLKHMLYGKILMVDNIKNKERKTNTTFVADYSYNTDIIRLSKKIAMKQDVVFSLMHEIGHRVENKLANSARIKEKYNQLYHGNDKVPQVGDDISYTWKEKDSGDVKTVYLEITDIDKTQIYFKDNATGRSGYSLPIRQLSDLVIVNKGEGFNWFPTPYSKRNFREWFAEIFAYGIISDIPECIDFIKSVMK